MNNQITMLKKNSNNKNLIVTNSSREFTNPKILEKIASIILSEGLRGCFSIVNNSKVQAGSVRYSFTSTGHFLKAISDSILQVKRNYSDIVELVEWNIDNNEKTDSMGNVEFTSKIWLNAYLKDKEEISSASKSATSIISKKLLDFNDGARLPQFMQGEGSKRSYLQRYNLKKLLGCETSDKEIEFEQEIAYSQLEEKINKTTTSEIPIIEESQSKNEEIVSKEEVEKLIKIHKDMGYLPKSEYPKALKIMNIFKFNKEAEEYASKEASWGRRQTVCLETLQKILSEV